MRSYGLDSSGLDRKEWMALVNTVVNLQVAQNIGKFLSD
jgi:hypothetical protein